MGDWPNLWQWAITRAPSSPSGTLPSYELAECKTSTELQTRHWEDLPMIWSGDRHSCRVAFTVRLTLIKYRVGGKSLYTYVYLHIIIYTLPLMSPKHQYGFLHVLDKALSTSMSSCASETTFEE